MVKKNTQKQFVVGVDGNEANTIVRVGVNTYAFNVLWSLSKLVNSKKGSVKVVVALSDEPHSDLPKETKYWEYKVLPARRKWILTALVPHLRQNKQLYDVFFTPSHYIPPFVPQKRVCSIMDLGYLESTEQFGRYDFWQLKYWSAYSIKTSDKVLAISAQTERDIVRHYEFASKKTFITHLAYDKETFNTNFKKHIYNEVLKKYSIVVDNYFVFVSTLKPSKNVEGLLRAWANFKTKNSNMKLVIVGKKGWMFDSIFSLVKELEIEESVIFTGYVSEDDKIGLIKCAKSLILPSFWEGFGLDILNAQACGVVPIVSKVGSLPEVAGKGAVFIDPYSPKTIEDAMSKLTQMSEKEYNELRELSLENAENYSWDKTARQTLEILMSV